MKENTKAIENEVVDVEATEEQVEQTVEANIVENETKKKGFHPIKALKQRQETKKKEEEEWLETHSAKELKERNKKRRRKVLLGIGGAVAVIGAIALADQHGRKSAQKSEDSYADEDDYDYDDESLDEVEEYQDETDNDSYDAEYTDDLTEDYGTLDEIEENMKNDENIEVTDI